MTEYYGQPCWSARSVVDGPDFSTYERGAGVTLLPVLIGSRASSGQPYDFRNLLISRLIWVETQSRNGISASSPLMSMTFLVKAFTGSGGGSFLNGACPSSLLMSNHLSFDLLRDAKESLLASS